MNEQNPILTELQALSPSVAAIARVNVYKVPSNYFEYLPADIIATVKMEALKTTNNYSVPNGYFENLSTAIFDKIKLTEQNTWVSELTELSPVLANIGNKNVYNTPDKYFETLEHKKHLAEPAKVIAFGNKRSVFKYAAAAVVTGLLGFGIFTFVNKNMAAAPTAQTASLIKKADEIIKTNSFDATLESLTDKDLEQYLTQNGENIEAALVASTADESNLPEAIDYYLDPNTLDNYLNENNLKN
jgi:hypothetical protein